MTREFNADWKAEYGQLNLEHVAKKKQKYIHCESKKLGHLFTPYNFRDIEQIFTKFGTNQSLFILNIVREFI